MRLAVVALTCLLSILLASGGVADMQEVDSGLLDPGESFSWTFEEPGEFDYHCHPHQWMTGRVSVMAGDPDREPTQFNVSIVEGDEEDDWGYDPAHLEVYAGDTVVWTNEGTMVHTVSQDHEEDEHGMGGDMDGHDDLDPYIPGPAVAVFLLVLLAGLVWTRRG
jgi:plastocyanin